jgi:hypothetical protein
VGGGVDELVVLESLLGLLVHWFLISFICSPRSRRFEEIWSRVVTAQSFKFTSAAGGLRPFITDAIRKDGQTDERRRKSSVVP